MQRNTLSKTLLSGAAALVLAGGSVLAQPGDLQITVDYQGFGDGQHRPSALRVPLRYPNISQDSLPIWTGQLAENRKTLTAGDIGASTVWVAVTFDETGGYDPFAGPPPSGSPLAIHSADQTGNAQWRPVDGRPGDQDHDRLR